MSGEPIVFSVFGKPQTQGSTRAIPMKKKGGGFQTLPDGRPRLLQSHQSGEKLLAWRQDVATAARAAYDGPLLTGPIALTLIFERPRPRGQFGTGRNAEVLKPSAPQFPTTKPDTVKLTRAVEDALSGVLWHDDAQVVDHNLAKRFGTVFCLHVRVSPL